MWQSHDLLTALPALVSHPLDSNSASSRLHVADFVRQIGQLSVMQPDRAAALSLLSQCSSPSDLPRALEMESRTQLSMSGPS